MFVRRLQRSLRTRQRAQGLVEYGLIAATVAFISIAGLYALQLAQRNYLSNLPLAPAAPSAPGALLHPTSVSPSTCTPNPWPLGTALTCGSSTVSDTYSDPSDLKRPVGTLNWLMGTTLIATCNLPAGPPASTNSCVPTYVSPMPMDPSLLGTQSITVKYENPQSNHLASVSTATQITVVVPIVFSPSPYCGIPASHTVEVGSPITCTVSLFDSLHRVPAVGLDVTWKLEPAGSSGTGDSFLSCATGGDVTKFLTTMWGPPSCLKQGQQSQLTCTTDGAGKCSVVYRRIRDSSLSTIDLTQGAQQLTVSMITGSLTSGSAGWSGAAITIGAVVQKHTTRSWLICDNEPGDPNAANVQPVAATNLTLNVPYGKFAVTPDVFVRGDSALVRCVATVVDGEHSTALNCSAGPPPSCGVVPPDPNPRGAVDPDQQNGNAPLGTVTWYTYAEDDPLQVHHPIANSTCRLARLDPPNASPPYLTARPEAPNQSPYASQCVAPIALTVTGDPAIQERVHLAATYSGSAGHQVSLDHTTVFTFSP